MAGTEPASAGGEPVLPGGRGMSVETTAGTRTLKSITSLVTVSLACVVLAILVGVAAYLLGVQVMYIAAGGLALVGAVPLFLMFQRVKVVENDIAHREALS